MGAMDSKGAFDPNNDEIFRRSQGIKKSAKSKPSDIPAFHDVRLDDLDGLGIVPDFTDFHDIDSIDM